MNVAEQQTSGYFEFIVKADTKVLDTDLFFDGSLHEK